MRGGISYYTYLYLDEESRMVCTTTYEPWNLLTRKIRKKFLNFWCSIMTNTCMVSYRTTLLGVLLSGTKVREDTYACLTRCNKFLVFSTDNAHLITVITIHENQAGFDYLKAALITADILKIPDFIKPF
jgi:hypothetical protein